MLRFEILVNIINWRAKELRCGLGNHSGNFTDVGMRIQGARILFWLGFFARTLLTSVERILDSCELGVFIPRMSTSV